MLHQLREWDLDEQCQRQTTDGHSGSLRLWTPISAWARPARHYGSLVRWPLSFTALLGEFASRAAATIVVTLLFVVTCFLYGATLPTKLSLSQFATAYTTGFAPLLLLAPYQFFLFLTSGSAACTGGSIGSGLYASGGLVVGFVTLGLGFPKELD